MSIGWLLAAGLSFWTASAGDEPRAAGTSHLRPLDSLAAAAIEEGPGRSATYAALARFVEDSDFIVYVESSRKLKGGMLGCLVHGGTGSRFLRIVLKTGLSVEERIEVLAHELQHAREVIQAGIPNEPAAMNALFSRIGYNKRQRGSRSQEYETEAAVQIAATVARELRENRIPSR